MDWNHLAEDMGRSIGIYEHSNESWGFMKAGEVRDFLSNCQLLKKVSDTCMHFRYCAVRNSFSVRGLKYLARTKNPSSVRST